MRLFTALILIGGTIMLSACGGQSLSHYQHTTPVFDLQKFFTGPIKGWGIIQDRSGKITQRFDVKMIGTWQGDSGTLEEDFVFYDGKTQRRVWTIKRLTDGTYIGTASDIINEASGESNGSAMRWKYQMDLPVDGTTHRVTFDDWMYQMNDDVVINRSYIKKFGITWAELTLFMQKQ